MRIIEPSYEILTPFSREDALAMLKHIEACARVCYKSEGKITEDSAPEFVRKIAKVFKHESVIEHASISVKFIVDRGVTHELVRHRIAAYSQESTRYCNYCKDGFGNEITVIKPLFFEEGSKNYVHWFSACQEAEINYLALIANGSKPQEARSVLPNSLKTEIMATFNLREWRHVFRLRTAANAHPQIAQVMRPLLGDFQKVMPELFDDISY
jgi:thymidylate synthase (FAD)